MNLIAISAGEEVRNIEEVYEPYLIQIGFIKRTLQGRKTNEAATLALPRHFWQFSCMGCLDNRKYRSFGRSCILLSHEKMAEKKSLKFLPHPCE
jgi:hypothetical protein